MEKGDIGLVLLDIMMPVMDGITVLSKLRKTSNVPVILLTAKGEDTDKVLGLDVGADDYITKPFNPMEVLARVKSQLRRYLQLGAAVVPTTELHCGPVSMDDRSKTVTVDGDPISLTPTEYEILKLFLTHPGQVFSMAEIYRQVWKEAPLGAEGTVAVHIRHLSGNLIPCLMQQAQHLFGIHLVFGTAQGYHCNFFPHSESSNVCFLFYRSRYQSSWSSSCAS